MAALAHSAPVVIAHRGASGYLPEHTLEAKALAIGLGADFIEQDVVLTADGVPIVTHDITLEDVTDIAARFPHRARPDGKYYAIDFKLEELRALSRRERVDDQGSQVFPNRFPSGRSRFGVVTLAEEIEFLQGVNRAAHSNVGLYTEVKFPAWHRERGKDITLIVLDVLAQYGYRTRSDHVYLQCFDAGELKRVRRDLHSQLKLIQLIGENSWHESATDYDAMQTEAGIADVATYADGIGPEITQLIEWRTSGERVIKPLARWAHARGLLIHPYTLRIDSLPRNAPDAQSVMKALFDEAGVEGIFTDFTDVTREFIRAHYR